MAVISTGQGRGGDDPHDADLLTDLEGLEPVANGQLEGGLVEDRRFCQMLAQSRAAGPRTCPSGAFWPGRSACSAHARLSSLRSLPATTRFRCR